MSTVVQCFSLCCCHALSNLEAAFSVVGHVMQGPVTHDVRFSALELELEKGDVDDYGPSAML